MKTAVGKMVVIIAGVLAIAGCAGTRPGSLNAGERRLVPCPALPRCVSSLDEDRLHRIAPLPFHGDPDAAFARLKLVLAQRTDATIKEESPGYLRVELHTTLFVDDGEFLLDPGRKVIQVRSASRLGFWDLGKNRSRLEEIRRQFLALAEKE